MDDHDNAAYYLTRAQEEERAALSAANPLAARIHRSLACRYRASAAEAMRSKRLSSVRD